MDNSIIQKSYFWGNTYRTKIMTVLGMFFFVSYLIMSLFAREIEGLLDNCRVHYSIINSISCNKVFGIDILGFYLTAFSLPIAMWVYWVATYFLFVTLVNFQVLMFLGCLAQLLFGAATIFLSFKFFFKLVGFLWNQEKFITFRQKMKVIGNTEVW